MFPQAEECRRTFWSLYLLDRLISCGRARPPAIVEASCQLRLPCTDDAWRDGSCNITQKLESLADRDLCDTKEQAPLTLVVLASHVLSRCTQYMLQDCDTRSRYLPWDPNSNYASIASDVFYLQSHYKFHDCVAEILTLTTANNGHIDQSQAGPMVFARALVYLTSCLLNHPFLTRRRLHGSQVVDSSYFLSNSFDTCQYHARRLSSLLHNASEAGCFMLSSFYGYCAVVAGSIHILSMNNLRIEVDEQDLRHLQSCESIIDNLTMYWANASLLVRRAAPSPQSSGMQLALTHAHSETPYASLLLKVQDTAHSRIHGNLIFGWMITRMS